MKNKERKNVQLLTIREASQLTKLSVGTLYQWTSMRRIPFLKLGRALRFDEQELVEWLEDKRTAEKVF